MKNMTLLQRAVKYGEVRALDVAGYHNFAKMYRQYEKKIIKILKTEGQIPFEEMSDKNQKILNEFNSLKNLLEERIYRLILKNINEN